MVLIELQCTIYINTSHAIMHEYHVKQGSDDIIQPHQVNDT